VKYQIHAKGLHINLGNYNDFYDARYTELFLNDF